MSAAFLDALLGVPFAFPGVVALFVGPRTRSTCTDFDGVETACDVPTPGTIAVATAMLVLGGFVYLVVYVRMLGRGATWGRGAVGYRVVDAGMHEPIGTFRALLRRLTSILSALPCHLGFLGRCGP